ncbi:MAG: CDP-alcohol phosphatidyltransferase family protein [Acidimicrobiales bacterium]|jgi:CDP-diacylglycerol--glycerol-3-phosphate 3-phosphatidyltransferase
MFDGKFRKSVDASTAPVGRWLVRIGFSADVLTASGLVFACATAWAIAVGHHHLAVVLLIATGAHDLFDGPVAKASHRASQRGSYFDSVVDRLSDAVLLGGCAYYLTAQHRGQLVLLPIGIMVTTFMISYQRSKAESLGLAAKGGLMERAERLIVLGVALLATQIFVPVLWALLALTIMTALGRFWRVWQIAASPEPPVRRRPVRNYQHTTRLRRGPSRTSRH